jgi:hypothetical protein
MDKKPMTEKRMAVELCDIQNEQAAQLAKQKPVVKPSYKIGYGPNPEFHDPGVGKMKRTVKVEADER